MRLWTPALSTVLGLPSAASAQRLGWTHRMLPAQADASVAVALGDLDGDGDLDAFVGNFGQDRLQLNDGSGVYTDVAATNLPAAPSDESWAVALGDVDGDGDLDALVGNTGQSGLYLNGSTGVFTDATVTNLPVSTEDTRGVALGDVDGDGDLDALLGNFHFSAGAQSRLYINGGTGLFTDVTATNLPALLARTLAVALGDLDGDGDLDAYLGNSGFGSGQQDRLYLNGGTGAFVDVTATNLPAIVDSTLSVALGDLDGDGDLDAFVGNTGPGPGGQSRLYLNDGTGDLSDATSTNVPALALQTSSVALGDVDGDGDLDAFVGNSGPVPPGGQNRLFLNGGTGIFSDVTATSLPAATDSTAAVALGDADADGDLDLFQVGGGQDRLHLNDGSGVFADVTGGNVSPQDEPTNAVALGDVDGDGDLDAFVANDFNGQNRLHLNDGTGVFTDVTATNLPALVGNGRAVRLGDVDGDGDLDAFVGNEGQNRLQLNDGSGVYTDVTVTNLPAFVGHTRAVALEDVDGDGDLDAFLGNFAVNPSVTNRLFLNGGTGIFTDATAANLPSPFLQTTAVAFGDVDGDGDLDAFVANTTSSFPTTGAQNRLYRNGGTGAFLDVTLGSLPSLLDDSWAVALGDVDGDGDLDALVGNGGAAGGEQNRLHLNGGAGNFTDATASNWPALIARTYAVALGDADGDGDLDAFVGTAPYYSGGGQERLYLNGGAGVFTDVTSTSLPTLLDHTRAIVLGDVDGDGDLDAFKGEHYTAGNAQNRLYTNLSRQVAWRGIPRVGKPLLLDLWGPAGGFWILGASIGSASLPLPPLGTLRLDPATLIVASGGALSSQGEATLSLLVPSSPALVGVSLYWQAVVGPPPLLTNLEITTATNL